MTIPRFPPDYPSAIVFPAHEDNAYNPDAHGSPNRPRAFVIHTPEEPADNYPGTPHWFAQYHPNQRGSTHYFVATNGDVYQCVPERWGAIANGQDGKPLPAWADKGTSLNWQTLSVEVEGYAASIQNTLNAAQFDSLVRLVRHRCLHYGIPLGRDRIIGHYEVSINRTDPGAGFPWARFVEAVKGDAMTADEKKAFDAVAAAVFDIQKQVNVLRGEVQATFALAVRNQSRIDALEKQG